MMANARNANPLVSLIASNPLIARAREGLLGYLIKRVVGGIAINDGSFIFDQYANDPGADQYAMESAYKINPWVYRCVQIVSKSVGGIPIRLVRDVKEGDKLRKEEVPGHEIAMRMRKPAPRAGQRKLVEATIAYQLLTGNAYWYIFRGNATGGVGKPVAIFPLRPDRMRKAFDNNGKFIGWLYSVAGAPLKMLDQDVIHFAEFSPDNEHYGMSPLEVLRYTYADDMEARKWNRALLRNSGVPRGGLQTDAKLNDTQVRQMEAQWQRSQGGSDLRGKTAVLHSGFKWVAIGMTVQEMDFIEKLRLGRLEMGAVYGVPPAKLNDFEFGEYSNATVQERDFIYDTVLPWAGAMVDTVNANIDKLSSPGADVEGLAFEVDTRRIPALRRERADLMTADVAAIGCGRSTANEVRQRDNEEPVEWGDRWWRPMGVVSWDTPPATSPTFGEDSVRDNKPAKRERSGILPPTAQSIERATWEWRTFVLQGARFAPAIEAFVRSLLKDQLDDVLARIRKHGVRAVKLTDYEIETELLFDLEDAVKVTVRGYQPILPRIVTAGGKRGERLARISGVFTLRDPRAEGFLRRKEQKFARHINETTWNKLRTSMVEGMSMGEGSLKMSERVKELMANRSLYEVQRIARTEIEGAMNGGVDLAFKQSDVVETKIWIIAGDGKEREEHAAAADQEVPVDEPFIVGGETLEFPGDPAGSAWNVCECRCAEIAGRLKE